MIITMDMGTGIITAMTDPRPFDWHYSELTDDTVIGPGYRNTQNVRRYFIARLGSGFKFDRSFMAWMKTNSDATLGEAVAEWKRRNPGHD